VGQGAELKGSLPVNSQVSVSNVLCGWPLEFFNVPSGVPSANFKPKSDENSLTQGVSPAPPFG